MQNQRRLEDAYRFPGFVPEATVRGVFGDPKARIVRLQRLRKKRPAERVEPRRAPSTIARRAASATSPVATPASTWRSKFAASAAAGARP